MSQRLAVVALVCVGVVASRFPARAACPVSNGDFASNLNGWTGGASAFDGAVGNPAGSARVGPVSGNGVCQGFVQCVPIVAGDTCALSAQVFFPIGTASDGSAIVRYNFFSDNACQNLTSFGTPMSAPSGIQNSWLQFTLPPATAPAGTQSALVFLNLCAGSATALTANWDNVTSQAAAIPVTAIPALGGAGIAVLVVALAAGGLVALRALRK